MRRHGNAFAIRSPSTAPSPAYRAVLDLHGWGDLHRELNRLSKSGDWTTMMSLIEDEVLNTFAVQGEPKAVGTEIVRRFDHLVDRFTSTRLSLSTTPPGRRSSRDQGCSALRGRRRGGGIQKKTPDGPLGLVGVQRLEHRRRRVPVQPLEDGALAEGTRRRPCSSPAVPCITFSEVKVFAMPRLGNCSSGAQSLSWPWIRSSQVW